MFCLLGVSELRVFSYALMRLLTRAFYFMSMLYRSSCHDGSLVCVMYYMSHCFYITLVIPRKVDRQDSLSII